MDLQLKDRTVIVTGASSGVGLATAKYLLDEGARVVACARDLDRLTAVFAFADPSQLLLGTCDVTDRSATDGLVAQAVDRFGGVDGLVCNAGRSLMATLDETSDDQFREEFELKIFGAWNMIRSARAELARSGHGSVVNVNAILARQPETRLAATSASRAALLNLTRSLSEDLAAEGTRVNSVLLGLIDTGQWRRRFEAAETTQTYEEWSAEIALDRGIGLGRFGTAEEVAYHIVTFLSPLSGFTTGASVDVGGGVARYI